MVFIRFTNFYYGVCSFYKLCGCKVTAFFAIMQEKSNFISSLVSYRPSVRRPSFINRPSYLVLRS